MYNVGQDYFISRPDLSQFRPQITSGRNVITKEKDKKENVKKLAYVGI